MVSDTLRRAVLRSGRTLRDLQGATGVSTASLSRFLRQERGLTQDAIDRLAEEVGLVLRPGRSRKS